MGGKCLLRGFNPQKNRGDIQNGVPVALGDVLLFYLVFD
jgi:hypothetical protein